MMWDILRAAPAEVMWYRVPSLGPTKMLSRPNIEDRRFEVAPEATVEGHGEPASVTVPMDAQ
jgi:hypothetical protein